MLPWWVGLIIGIVCLLVGGLLGFFVARILFGKQLKDNPLITENQIRAMYSEMGRKPSEAQIRRIKQAMMKGGRKQR